MATGGEEKVGYRLVRVGTVTLENSDKDPRYNSIVVCQDKIVVLDGITTYKVIDLKTSKVKIITYKVNIHGLHDGKFLASSGRLESVPRDMCLMDAMTICVIHYDGLIKMMSIDSTDMSRVIKTTNTLRLQGLLLDKYDDVVRFEDSLVVTGVKEGMMYWCIVSLQDGHVDKIHQICKGDGLCKVTTKDNIIYISCYATGSKSPDTGVYGFDILNPSQCKYTYKHQRLQDPTSIVINEDGNIFVCNTGDPDSCIHQLTASCQLVAIFTQGIPSLLHALFWDNGRLYGTCIGSRDITVFSHMYQGNQKYSEVETSMEIEQGNLIKQRAEEKLVQAGIKKEEVDLFLGFQDEIGTNLYFSADQQSLTDAQKSLDTTESFLQKNRPDIIGKWLEYREQGKLTPELIGPVFYDEGKTKMDMEDGKEKVCNVQPSLKPPFVEISEIPEHSENAKQGRPGGTSAPVSSDTAYMDGDQDIELIDILRKVNLRRIGDIFRQKRYPAKIVVTDAIKECGYNKGVQCLLSGMSNVLRKKNPHATSVWCGYRLQNPYTPLFVANLCKHTCVPGKSHLPKVFHDYDILFRYKHTPNNEETFISEMSEKTVSSMSHDTERVQDCIARNTERLMKEHSNISIITASTIKAVGFNGSYSSLKLMETICIVLYVPVKGIIPIGEKEFPKDIDGIVTDVREGEFVFHVGESAGDRLSKLRMGCSISPSNEQSGTLGGFIDLPDDKVCCITAAHVVLSEGDRKQYAKYTDPKKCNYNDDLAKGKKVIKIYQPSPTTPDAEFGNVRRIVFEEGSESVPSVDVAIIEITDDERRPDAGNFPLDSSSDMGFTKEQPMMYTSGKAREDLNTLNRGCIVMKYGSVTGITSGRLMWNGASVRVVDTIGKSWKEVDYMSNPTFFRQVVVKPCGGKTLAKPGDSGALVFHCNGGDIRDLEAIGLHIGGTTNKKSGFMLLCSPIKLVFEQLKLSNNMFKRFQHIVQADQTIYSMQSQEIDHIKISHTKLEEQMQQLKDEMKSNATALEQKLKEEMKSNATALEQKLNEMQANTTAAMATALEQNMQRLIGMLSRTEEHKPSSE